MLLGRHGPGGTAEVSVLIESVVADQFLALLPDGEWHARVVFVLRLYLGMRLPWYVEVACRSGDQGRLCLGGKAWCRLGWDAWLSNSAGGERCVRVAASN
ncbi:type VI secretion system baseplate subunit TssG [Cupriavidus sp. D39]|uniref:type VI secretion system baseplate subunit TssG n=1 Tax=Cupriavidus sp. D39 TaxID=2997877 RepID=UPI003B64242C